MDALQAIRLTNDYQLKAILVLGRDCHEAADQIAASKLKVILDETLVFWRTDERTGKDERIVLPKVFREREVPITFQVSGTTAATRGSNYLWYQAATAVKYGMPVQEALRAITLGPAEMLGVAEFVGSIEPNKDADLVILSGDPLKVNTWVETTIIGGRVVYERSKDARLKRLLEEPPQ
jgi:imidazolonepropionase-like amidohydrolase